MGAAADPRREAVGEAFSLPKMVRAVRHAH